MTVREYIETRKQTMTLHELTCLLKVMRSEFCMSGFAGYDGNDLNREYSGKFDDVSNDPYIENIAVCEKVIEMLENLSEYIEKCGDANSSKVKHSLSLRN